MQARGPPNLPQTLEWRTFTMWVKIIASILLNNLRILVAVLLASAFAAFVPAMAAAQGTASQGMNAGNVTNLLSMAFSGGQVVQGVQLSGTAIWNAGGQEDIGTVTLTASSDGSTQMQIDLASAGQSRNPRQVQD